MKPIHLCAVNSSLKARRWRTDDVLCIGANEDQDISCSDASLSAQHARVVVTDRGWIIHDQHSGTGTFVNGKRIGSHGRKLIPGDMIQCGLLSLKVVNPEAQFLRTSTSLVRIQAVAQRSWEKALQTLTHRPAPSDEQSRHLLTLFRTGYHLCQVACPEELVQTILNDTVSVLEAQRGSIVLADTAGTLRLSKTARAERAPHFRKWYSRTLVQRSFSRGESILCEDVGSSQDHAAQHSMVRQNMASIICALLRTPRRTLGVLHLDRGPAQHPFTLRDFSLADAIAASVSAALETAQLLGDQRDLFLRTVTALARAVELRDLYTGNHTQRVVDYAMLLATELGLVPAERHVVHVGTLLHDIGKIGIADSILLKPDKLSAAEFAVMRSHADVGAALLEAIPGLRPMIDIIRHHHERWDGKGYPHGLKGDGIPRLARIVAVADAFDAMTSDRPYRRAMSWDEAFATVAHDAGSHFDPECARALMSVRPHMMSRATAPPAQGVRWAPSM